MAKVAFNAAEVEPQTEYQPLPAGDYKAIATATEVKATKSGGEMIVCKMQVLEGQYTNRTVFARFNVRNDSAQAEQIGRAQLSAFCRAVGVMNLTDTDELLHKPVMIRVKVREAQGAYGPSNEVSGFMAADASAPPPAAPAQALPAGARTMARTSKPWEKAA